MVLRIEDTDLERSEARFRDLLIQDLKWLGILIGTQGRMSVALTLHTASWTAWRFIASTRSAC